MVTEVPQELEPYLADMLGTGLYGNSRSEVIANCLRDGIKQAVSSGLVRLRLVDVGEAT